MKCNKLRVRSSACFCVSTDGMSAAHAVDAACDGGVCDSSCDMVRTRGGLAQRELTAIVASSGGTLSGGASSGGVLSGGVPSSEPPLIAVISTSGLVFGCLAVFSAAAGGVSRRRSKEKPCHSVEMPTKISAMRIITCSVSYSGS